MKRLIPLLLCLALLGCGQRQPPAEATTPTIAQSATQAPQPHYDGALTGHALTLPQVRAIRPMGSRILVVSGTDPTTLTLLSGEDLRTLASTQLPFALDPESPDFSVTETGLRFFDPIAHAFLLLDEQLEVTASHPLPESFLGSPLLSSDQRFLYFLTPTAIFRQDLTTGQVRTLTELCCQEQALTGLHCDNTVLQCRIREGETVSTLLLCAETGALLHYTEEPLSLTTLASQYYAGTKEGFAQLLLFGDLHTQPQLLYPAEHNGPSVFLPGNHALVTCNTLDQTTQLQYYSLATGLIRAEAALPQGEAPVSIHCDSHGYVWILTSRGDPPRCSLYRWEISDPAFAPAQSSQVYICPYASTEAQWASVRETAQALSQRFGISILLGQEALDTQPWDYSFQAASLPQILLWDLQRLEVLLSSLPQTILDQTASHFDGFSLCLVASITGRDGQAVTGVQYLQDHHAYVAITTGTYTSQALYHELFHMMETHILTGSTALDNWNQLNPRDFAYSFGAEPSAHHTAFLSGAQQAFVDSYSMTYPREDRARVFERAMLPGNRQLFSPPAMQKKLAAICTGIRQAYGLEDSPDIFPWEQYLQSPLILP